MLDFDKSITSSLLQSVDQVGANLVSETYQHLVQSFSSFIWTMTAIYIGFLFLQAKQGRLSFYDLINATFRTVAILTLAMNYHYFCLFIYDVFTLEPLVILKAITLSGKETTVISINQALDQFTNQGLSYANKVFLMGSWNNLTYFIFAFLVFAMTVLSSIIAVGLIILSKCAMVILLALSPLFIFCAQFNLTKGIFEAYVRHLITYALIPILTASVLMILFSVSEYVVTFMNQFPQASFKAVTPFLLFCGIQIYLLAQVFSKASALGAGFALGSVVSTLSKVNDNMKSSANALTGGEWGRGAFGKLSHFGSVRSTSRFGHSSNRK